MHVGGGKTDAAQQAVAHDINTSYRECCKANEATGYDQQACGQQSAGAKPIGQIASDG